MFNNAKRSGEGILVTEVKFDVVRDKETKEEKKKVLPEIVTVVISAIAPVIVERGLDRLGKLLEQKINDYCGTSSAMGVEELYYRPASNAETLFNIEAVIFKNQRLGNTLPDLKAKFGVETSTDGRAFRLELNELVFNATSAKKIKDDRKDLLFTGVFELPYCDLHSEDDRKNAKFGAFQVAVRDVKLKTNEQDLAPAPTTHWIPLPANKEKESQEFLTRPFSLFMTAVEAEEPGDLLLLARDLFSESKDTLKEELTDLIKDALGSDAGKVAPTA
jgi:hypothetical protein